MTEEGAGNSPKCPRCGRVHVSEEQRRQLTEAGHYLLAAITRVEIGSRDEALRHASRGDYAPLGEYIRQGGRLTPALRPVVAEALQKNRPHKKIRLAAADKRDLKIAAFIFETRARGVKGKDLEEAAEKKFRRTWRQLQKSAAKHKGYGKAVSSVRGLRSAAERVHGHVCGDNLKPLPQVRYLVWPGARTAHTLP